jgi:RsiW-degrading membrane proteinase PrsW (M82 family)
MGKYNGNTEFVVKSKTGTLRFWDCFSDTFKSHSMKDVEKLFMSGMAGTTPPPDQALLGWQKPWLYARAFILLFILAVISFFLEIYSNIQLFELIGSSVIPLTMLVFMWEMNIYRNIPLYMVVFMFVAGGILSILFTVMNTNVRYILADSGFAMNLMNGVLEEGAKLLAIVIFVLAGRGKFRGILPGLLIGCAVGAGFSAFESWQYFDNSGGNMFNMLLRAVISPGSHPIWAAMYGGGLIAYSGKITVKSFTSKIFLVTIASAIGLHTLWNTSAETNYALMIITALIIIAWVILGKLFALGVTQASSGVYSQPVPSVPYAPSAQPAPKAVDTFAQLYFLSGSFTGKSIPVNHTLTIGRDPNKCNLIMGAETKGISRVHCRLSFSNGTLVIEDLGSSGGTYLENGERINPGVKKALRSGQKVYLGSRSVMFEIRM